MTDNKTLEHMLNLKYKTIKYLEHKVKLVDNSFCEKWNALKTEIEPYISKQGYPSNLTEKYSEIEEYIQFSKEFKNDPYFCENKTSSYSKMY